MKGKLLLAMLFATLVVTAQETHHINWFMGVSSTEASLTINQGDIVVWTWTDALPHTVTSNAGGAESFNSGNITGNGQTFSHTFVNEGSTTYKCNVHSMMTGTITVSAVAGIGEISKKGLEFYPNPATDVLTINSEEVIDSIQIYDMNGKEIMNSKSGNTTSKIYMDNYPAGIYYVKVFAGENAKGIKVIKN